MTDILLAVLIVAVILFLAGASGGWFKDWAELNYETGFLGFLPLKTKNLNTYIFAYRAWLILGLLYVIIAYVLSLVTTDKNVLLFLFFGIIMVVLLERVIVAFFTDDYMDLYEKKIYEPIVPENPHAYAIAQRVINISLFLIVAAIYLLVITGVIFGD